MKESTRERGTRSRSEYWREQVARQEISGQSVKQYCETQDVAEQSFYVWRKRLQKETAVRFALVETRAAGAELPSDAALELILGQGERLRIGPTVDLTLLRRVVEALRG